MFLFAELKHLLLQVLPSPTMMAQGRLLCIQNHLAMICDSLWAINSMIVISDMRVVYMYWIFGRDYTDQRLDAHAEFIDWMQDMTVAIIDLDGLLGRILDWEPSLHRSIVGNTQQVHFRHVILVELKEMSCNLNSLVLRGSAMGLGRDPMESMNPLQEDYSVVLKNEVIGREEDLKKLIAIIQQQPRNNGDDSDPFVIVILGKKGVGKTTFAHMIYHHTWIRQQFHHRIWVNLPVLSISNMVNIIGKEFARYINNEEYCEQKLQLEQPPQAMWEYINEQLDGSRYLLVLHFEEWTILTRQVLNELKNILLRVGGPGSAVLIIHKSSAEELSNDMGFLNGMKDITTYPLNPLSEDASLELFKRLAATTIPPWKQDKSEKDELIPFVKQHLQSSICQPFLAKIVASLGRDIQARQIRKGYDSDDFLKENFMLKDSPFFVMRLNQYDHLFDVDTDDVQFDVASREDNYNVVLHMLTAECLIPAEGLESGWIEGHETYLQWYLDLSEHMFPRMVYLHMKVPEDSINIPRSCRYLFLEINPRTIPFRLPTLPVEVIDNLITFILQENQEKVEETTLGRPKAATAILKFLSKMWVRLVHLRILVVESSMIQRLPSEVSKLVNLRYLHLSKLKMELLPKSLFELSNLRILSLLRCGKLQKIPERIRKLKKLQILKVAYCTKLQRLPKSITTLKNLEVLNVEGCCWLSELPKDFVGFKSLKILDVTGCASLSQMPREIEQLIGLRKLLGISVGVDGGFGLAQLQALTNLQEIRLRNLKAVKETQTEVLMGQKRLQELSLHWGGEEAKESSSESAAPLQVLEALRPNVHLRKLEIISYKGVEFPTWMSKQQLARLHSLVEIRLVNLRSCATLPSLGQLPFLSKLEISGMDLITHIDNSDGDIFPVLRELTFSEMFALEKWSELKRINAESGTTRIQTLTLIQCPKFKEIDLLFDPRIEDLRVWLNNETIWSAEFCSWDNLRYIEKIEIVGCQELRHLPQSMGSLRNLEEMTINGCNNLVTLVALGSLRRLYLYACPILEFNLEAFTYLSDLKIKGCPKMQIYSDDAWLKKIQESRRKKEERWNKIEELWRKNNREELKELRRKMIEELEGKNLKELEEFERKKIEEFGWEDEEEESEEFWRKKIEALEIRKLLTEKIWEFYKEEKEKEQSKSDNTNSSLSQT